MKSIEFLKRNKDIILLSLISSLMVYGTVSNKIINKRIENRTERIHIFQNFYNDFGYTLSDINKEKAQKIINNLSNDALVYKRFVEYHSIDSLLTIKLRLLKKNPSNYKLNEELSSLIKKREDFLLKISKDLYKKSYLRKQYRDLFTIFLTNTNFKNRYNSELIYAKLKQNPYTFFYSNRLQKKIKPFSSTDYVGKDNTLKGFKSKYSNKELYPENKRKSFIFRRKGKR
jgi:hypothetical protein